MWNSLGGEGSVRNEFCHKGPEWRCKGPSPDPKLKLHYYLSEFLFQDDSISPNYTLMAFPRSESGDFLSSVDNPASHNTASVPICMHNILF